MNRIDQNSALLSTQNALETNQELVDNRSVVDHLDFLVRFSTLLNHYDEHGRITGGWSPFLLKDPVFLVAHISKKNVRDAEFLFQSNVSIFEKEVAAKKNFKTSDKIRTAATELFLIYFDVFSDLVQWTYFMQQYPKDYLLKKFVLREVSNKYAPILWSLMELRNNLYNRSWLPKPKVVRPYSFEETDQYYWLNTKGLTPYWKILDLHENFKDNSAQDICKSMRKQGQAILSFLKQIVMYAGEDYKSLSQQSSLYPDTTLLRALTSMLSPYKEQFNALGKAHLDFYYQSVLKQKKQGIHPDRVFVDLALSKEEPFVLAANTPFVGGKYADGQPILFENLSKSALNPAKVSNTYTLFKSTTASTKLEALYLAENKTVSTLNKSEDGQIKGWDTFGAKAGSKTTFGFIIGSPLLLLKEGERTITFEFKFGNDVNEEFLKQLTFYLSTKESWYEVAYSPKDNLKNVTSNSCSLSFTLAPDDPSIEAFTISPDGLSSSWPQLKMEFEEVGSFSLPLELSKATVTVNVKGASDFVLSNDVGALDATKPFLPLGPTPLENANLYLGSNEFFSKPIDTLTLSYNWNNLPSDFFSYYFEYNIALVAEYLMSLAPSLAKGKKISVKVSEILKDLFFFNNNTFKVDFYAGRQREITKASGQSNGGNTYTIWKDLPLRNEEKNSTKEEQCLFSEVEGTLGANSLGDKLEQVRRAGKLGVCKFLIRCVKKILKDIGSLLKIIEHLIVDLYVLLEKVFSPFSQLAPDTVFSYSKNAKSNDFENFFNPSVQLKPLKLSDEDASGFIRMSLQDPPYGFGSDIYAKILSIISTFNGAQMIAAKGDPAKMTLLNPANAPFAPKLNSIIGNYSASFTYDLNYTTQAYPLECFYCTPFGDYKVYDATSDTDSYRNFQGASLGSISREVDYLPLHPSYEFEGALFVPFDKAATSSGLDLYFELVSHSNALPGDEQEVFYHYLSDTSWEPLSIQADTTKSLTCSGILSTELPVDSSSLSVLMPGESRWICLGVKKNAEVRANTVYLNSNGILLNRVMDVSEKNFEPKIAASAITKLQTTVKEIASISQPFPSFGGKSKESEVNKNLRVSNRLFTKDRVLTKTDFYRTLLQEFEELFYVNVLKSAKQPSPLIFCVKKVESQNDPDAYLPWISECELSQIASYVSRRTSPFSSVVARNFQPEYVRVIGEFEIENLALAGRLEREINDRIKLFLSPWISSKAKSIEIGKGISTSEIAALASEISGVTGISSLTIQSLAKDEPEAEETIAHGQELKPSSPERLLVPSMFNQIKCVANGN